MTYAFHLFNHSKKLRNAPNIIRSDPAILVRWFSKEACFFPDKGYDLVKIHQHGYLPRKRNGGFSSTSGGASSTVNKINYSSRAINSDIFMVNLVRKFNGNISRTATRMGIPVSGSTCNESLQMHLIRGFATDTGLPPHQEIGMPSLSPTMTEGNIARWLKKEGDKVSPGEVLCEVETDKATVEMECMEEGYIAKLIHGDGAKEIKVGEVIAITVEEEDNIGTFKDYKPSTSGAADGVKGSSDSATPKKEVLEEPLPSSEPKVSKAVEGSPAADRIFSSPPAKKLAEDHSVPLSSIKGTGPDGRVVKADIEDYFASCGKEATAPVSKAKDTAAVATLDYTDLPHTQRSKVLASLLLLSKQTIPHYYLTVDTCVDKLMELQSQLNSLQEASGGKQISVNDLVIKAAALALRKVPQCNSSWTNDYIRQYQNVNINVAVQTDQGTVAPVVRGADKKGLSKIAEEIKLLAQTAKDNSLELEVGTFTVVNLGGPFGIEQFCGIVIPPQSGLLAVGSAEKRIIPGVGPHQFKFASFMSVTLSCDHRVIDGAIGAEWLKAFKGYIENPESMLL